MKRKLLLVIGIIIIAGLAAIIFARNTTQEPAGQMPVSNPVPTSATQ